jgi:hypothetical protein
MSPSTTERSHAVRTAPPATLGALRPALAANRDHTRPAREHEDTTITTMTKTDLQLKLK